MLIEIVGIKVIKIMSEETFFHSSRDYKKLYKGYISLLRLNIRNTVIKEQSWCQEHEIDYKHA